MTTYIYNSTDLSVKDRLTISNLLTLFKSRLSANWVQAGFAKDQPAHLVLIDVDQPQGLQKLEADAGREARIAVTDDDRSRHPSFIPRPIRAFGPNGVIVLFNSIAQSLSSPARETRIEGPREPARIRMMGRMESPALPVRALPTLPPRASQPATARSAPPPPPVESPAPARVAVRWGPPQPVTLPPLIQMPGAKIHWRRPADQQKGPEISHPPTFTPAPPPVASPSSPQKLWSAPGAEALPPLVNMPTTHRPVEIHSPAAPLIGRTVAEPATPGKTTPPAEDLPTLRPSPPLWKAPEKEIATPLLDFRSPSHFEANPVERVPEIAADLAQAAAPETVIVEAASGNVAEQELEIIFAELEPSLASLSRALADEASPIEISDQDGAFDWWGTADLESNITNDSSAEGSTLIGALKAVKASAQPSILEVPGLPAVCVIPSRNVYFTTAPAARLESAIGARAEVTWRACSTEAEARELSGTEQSRQASLEQLSWTASLFSAPPDPDSMTDRAVRLRRWPPITESRGRSKFIRYATMLSGAQATPRELSEITGDPLDEIVCFVNACAIMNLLDTSSQESKGPLMAAPVRTGGAGILRDMIEQLTPPKI